jgi:hypothetical protein
MRLSCLYLGIGGFALCVNRLHGDDKRNIKKFLLKLAHAVEEKQRCHKFFIKPKVDTAYKRMIYEGAGVRFKTRFEFSEFALII